MISHEHKCIFVHIPKNAGSSVEKAFGFSDVYHQGTSRHSPPFAMNGYWGGSRPNMEYPFKKLYERPHHNPAYARHFHEYFKFAIVRNPWDRLVSTYKYDHKLMCYSDADLVANSTADTSKKWLTTRRDHLRELFGRRGDSFKDFMNCLADEWFGVNRDLPRPAKKYFSTSEHKDPSSPKQYSWIKLHEYSQITFVMDERNEPCLDRVLRFETLDRDWEIMCNHLGIDLELPHTNKSSGKHYTEYYDDETREMVARRYAVDIEYFNYEF